MALKYLVTSNSQNYKLGTSLVVHGLRFCLPIHGEGNGNPVQHSCLENLMDGGAW